MEQTEKKIKPTVVSGKVCPKARLAFPALFKARAFDELDTNSKAKFEATLLWPKDTDLTPVKKAVMTAVVEKWGKDKTKWPKKLRLPFRDGDEFMDLAGYPGTIFIRASSVFAPQVIDRYGQDITDQKQIYAGCYVKARLNAFAYETKGNVGVSLGVQAIQKVSDGERLDGFGDAKSDFDIEETSGTDLDGMDQIQENADDSADLDSLM